jgi:hypothetical protein
LQNPRGRMASAKPLSALKQVQSAWIRVYISSLFVRPKYVTFSPIRIPHVIHKKSIAPSVVDSIGLPDMFTSV